MSTWGTSGQSIFDQVWQTRLRSMKEDSLWRRVARVPNPGLETLPAPDRCQSSIGQDKFPTWWVGHSALSWGTVEACKRPEKRRGAIRRSTKWPTFGWAIWPPKQPDP